MSGTLQVGGVTLGTHNSGTGKVDLTNQGTVTLNASTTFPAGHQVFIKLQNRDGVGSVGQQSSYFPTTTTDLATKSFHLQITNSEHTNYTKLKIDFFCNLRINTGSSHVIIDIRLVRWLGTGNVSSETTLLQGVLGSVTEDVEDYPNFAGSYIDDISSIGSDQINYTVQYRSVSGQASNAGAVYLGPGTDARMQISAIGII